MLIKCYLNVKLHLNIMYICKVKFNPKYELL